jgi:hypothetical protein
MPETKPTYTENDDADSRLVAQVTTTDDGQSVVMRVSGFEGNGGGVAEVTLHPKMAQKLGELLLHVARGVFAARAASGAHGKLAERNRG